MKHDNRPQARMMRQNRITFLSIILTFAGITNSLACSCEGEGTVAGGVKHADVVFSGQVISRIVTKNYDSLGIVITGDTIIEVDATLK